MDEVTLTLPRELVQELVLASLDRHNRILADVLKGDQPALCNEISHRQMDRCMRAHAALINADKGN